ncbi:TetR/AcrR family transcriptional regulator [Streptomyces sp. NPDC093795]|uniref:TetR/AcrR family transcriptional regulator n=1 Tax=Streptomyces sp. NPDC093795 TaxID=3366051 RepID=UPI0038239B42
MAAKSTRAKKAGGGGREARRAELAEAVQRALLTRGLEGLRLRDVADEAGVTPAAVLYYGDLDALVHETYQQAIARYSRDREAAADGFTDARLKLRACIDQGVAAGPDDALTRLLFEYWPRCLRDAKAAALDSALTERQISVYAEILVLGRAQGYFVLQDPPRLIAANFVAMEDGYQMEVLAGRRTRGEVIAALSSYARAVTGHDPSAPVDGGPEGGRAGGGLEGERVDGGPEGERVDGGPGGRLDAGPQDGGGGPGGR